MQTKTRVVGSGFTTLNYRGKPIAFMDGFRDSGQTPIRPPEAVTPLGERHPVEFASARVLSEGTLTLTIRELWNAPVWEQLVGLAGVPDIVAVYEAIAREPADVTCQMVITSPDGVTRGKVYHGCLISQIPTDEDVTIGALTVQRQISVMYTHVTPIVASKKTLPAR